MGPFRANRSPCLLLAVLLFATASPARSPAIADSPSPAQTNALIDLDAYRVELARATEAIKDANLRRQLRTSLPSGWTVQHGSQQFTVSTKEISQALAQIELDPAKNQRVAAQLELRLHQLQVEADRLSHPHAQKPSEANAKLQEILSRSEFKDAPGPSTWDLMRARINRWIFVHIIRLLESIHISPYAGDFFTWTVIFAALVVLFYTVYRWLATASKSAKFRAEAEPVSSDSRHWLRESLAAAERGDYREAIHCAYWLAVARLEELRLLPKDRSRTPRESLRLLDSHPREKTFLQPITRSFELIWYGFRPASAADWMHTREQLEKMGCLQASTAPTVPS